MSSTVLLDTSAVIALIEDEEGADKVEDYLRDAERGKTKLLASFVTLTEVRYVVWQERSESDADRAVALLRSWPIEWVHSDERLCLLAGRLKARHRISLADAYVAAAAKLSQAVLVHKDPELEPLEADVALEALPYKKPRRRR